MPATSLAYRAAARLAVTLLPLVRRLSPKLHAGDLARRGAVARWQIWAAAHRDPHRPLLWVHAPSVGEGLQAEAVLQRLRPRHPDWQIVYTFFSPSAAALAARQPADHADYLPYDTAPNVDALLAALEPAALVFTKLDLWPELATRARARGVRVGMIAGTVSPVSGRRHPVARRLTQPGYRVLQRVGAIDRSDAEGLVELGVPADEITVTGDPRFDSALARVAALGEAPPGSIDLTAGGRTLVAGSTWPPDDAVLIDACVALRATHPEARLVLVPHEPSASHVERLLAQLDRRAIPATPWSSLAPGTTVPPVVVVDRVGLLAGLYRGAAVAYVGGGFGRAGLHSVLEPAACGVPVVMGPRWHSSRDAALLLDAGAAHALPEQEAAAVLAAVWRGWLDDPAARREAGRRGLDLLHAGQGAAERSAALVERLIGP